MRRPSFIAAGLCGALFAGAAQAAPQLERELPEPGQEQTRSGAAAAARTGPDYERIGRFIYAWHRAGVSVDKLRDPLIARRAPPELAQRASDLALKLEQITTMRASLTDQELKATLRESELVSAALAQWRQAPAADGLNRP